MKTPIRSSILGLGFLLACAGLASAAKVTPDLLPPPRRQATVTTAESLAERKAPPPLPSNLVSPFNPTDFDKTETPEAPRPGPVADARPAPPAPLGPKQILEVLASQLNPTGVIQGFNGKPLLLMGVKRFEVGTRFTVTYNNEDHELELVSIDRTTFTLRYRGEEIIRPIKSVR